jgi:hypothetical protein
MAPGVFAVKSPRIDYGGVANATPAQLVSRVSYQNTDDFAESHVQQPASPIVSLPSFLTASTSSLSSASCEDLSLEHKPTAPHPLPSTRHRSSSRFSFTVETWTSPMFCLASYFLLSLGLTLHNKFILVGFPYPFTMTALHMLFSSVGAYYLQRRGWYTPAKLSPKDRVVLAAFSVLYTVNMAISNVSLHLVSIPVCACVTGSRRQLLTSALVPSGCTRNNSSFHGRLLCSSDRRAIQSHEVAFPAARRLWCRLCVRPRPPLC